VEGLLIGMLSFGSVAETLEGGCKPSSKVLASSYTRSDDGRDTVKSHVITYAQVICPSRGAEPNVASSGSEATRVEPSGGGEKATNSVAPSEDSGDQGMGK